MDRQDLNAEIPRNANHQNLDNETRLLAYDYIDYRLQQNDLEWPNRPADSIPDPPTPLMLVMRATCDHFNERWFQRYGEMDEHIAASLPVLNSEGVEQAFANVSDALFRPNEVGDIEITWGRIFCIFAFGGSLAVHCAQQGTPELIDQVTEHLVTFATTRLLDWIASKGGWVSPCLFIFGSVFAESFCLISRRSSACPKMGREGVLGSRSYCS